MYHPFLSSNAFKVFDENHDGVVDFAEFLFVLACESNIDLATKYDYLFEL
jgi:Ca2+-binding EF-hand superfamily protein